MQPRRSFRSQKLRHTPELRLGDDPLEGIFHPDRRGLVLRSDAPHQRAFIGFVVQHVVDDRLRPEPPAGARDSLRVEGPGDVEDALARLGHSKHALHDRRRGRLDLQPGPLLRPVLHVHLAVAVGGVGSDPEAARRGLAHSPPNLLGKILAVKLVHALDDRLHQLARGRVVGVLGDGYDADAPAPQHGLEGDCVLSLACESREFPDENLPEWSVRTFRLVDHLSELRPVGDAPALGLVHVLAGHEVAVLVGVVPERPKLCGHRQVHVLPVAGDSRVERRRHGVFVFLHCVVLLCSSSCSSSRAFSLS